MNAVQSVSTLALALTLSLQASGRDEASGPAAPKKAYSKAARVSNADVMTELVFEPKTSNLTASAERHLHDFLRRAQGSGRPVDEVKILAWADQNYPSNSKKDLGKEDRTLADNRALEVRGFVQTQMPGVDVDVVNMAERPHELEKVFNTDDARLKLALERAGLLRPEKGPMPTRAGRVMVLFLMKE
ncbi:MAG: hypothetical protein AB7G93_08775 [Bdellovibrionales bacterium]